MSKPVVFVIGASGNIGAATVQALSLRYADNLEIRAGVRNPDSDKAGKLKLPGVTVVRTEMGAPDLKDTLKGVDALYIVTPGAENRLELTMAATQAAKEAGVKFLLAISLPSSKSTTENPINEIEDTIVAAGIPYCFLNLPFFYENYFAFMDTIKSTSAMYSPVDPVKPFAVVAASDAGKVGAAILADHSKHVGKSYQVTSAWHTYAGIAATFSEALGREVSYVRVPYDTAEQTMTEMGVPRWQIDTLFKFYHLIDSGALEAIAKDKVGDYKTITGEEPTDLKTWLAPIAGFFK